MRDDRGVNFEARPLTPETWSDLEELFALPGGSIVRGCWCMYYRRPARSRSSAAAGVEQQGAALRAWSTPGVVPGPGRATLDGRPAGWISLGPREDYLKLRRSPVMKPVDDARGVVGGLHLRRQGAPRPGPPAPAARRRDRLRPRPRRAHRSRPTRSTSPSAATTTSCSSARAASTSGPGSPRSSAAPPRAS